MVYPLYWSDGVWQTIHFIAFTYPETPDEKRKLSTLAMFEGLFVNLPCLGCAGHAVEYYKTTPPDVCSRDALAQWVVTFHNSVNNRLGKRSDWTVEEAKEVLVHKFMGDGAALSRADAKRLEDHACISRLKNRIAGFEKMSRVETYALVGMIMTIILCAIGLVGLVSAKRTL
jgi:hypothetical protein